MKGARILIVDRTHDDPGKCRVTAFKRMLRGNVIHNAHTGAGVVEKLKANKYEVVFIGMDGENIAKPLVEWMRRKDYRTQVVIHSLASNDYEDAALVMTGIIRAPWCWGDASAMAEVEEQIKAKTAKEAA